MKEEIKNLPEQNELIQLLGSENSTHNQHAIGKLQASEIAEAMLTMDNDARKRIFTLLPLEAATTIFSYCSLNIQKELLNILDENLLARILNNLRPDDRTQLLVYLPNNVVKELILLLSVEERKVTLTLLGYPQDSVGRLMTPEYIAVKEYWTIEETLKYIRNNGSDKETLDVIYVTNEKGILIDDIKIREFLISPLDYKVGEVMDRKFVCLNVFEDQESAISYFRKNDRVALPVVDNDSLLLGIVTIDDILKVEKEETTEDIQKIGGMESIDEPYMTIPFFQLIRKRAGWLVILFLGEMLTATAMSFFQNEISKAVVLALFVPLIISSGGNSGSQAASLIIRAMALGEVRLHDWLRVLKREFLSGIVLGTILGAIGFIRIFLWTFFTDIYGPHWPLVGIVVGLSLMGVVLWGTLSGSLLPIILKKAGFDPATSSAPFVATLVDVTGLVIYFTVAFLILKGTLL